MSVTTAVVKDRLAQGKKAAPGEFIDLLDGVDEVEKLFQAYLSLRDEEHAPEEKPAPLTTEVMKSYVRLIYDAINSTDEAEDAFNTGLDGQLKKTGAMKYVDVLNMFEVQVVAGRLVKTVHKVQSGTLSIPSWPILTALKLHKFKTFPDRMDKVIEALKIRKSICKALFFDELSMLQRVSLQPGEEANKKGTNANGNFRRGTQLLFARENMPKDEKPGTAMPGRGDGELEQPADHEGTDEDMELPKSKRARRTPADVAVTINPVSHRVKKPTAAGSAKQATDTHPAIQPAGPAAQASINTDNCTQSSKTKTTASDSINTGGCSIQPASLAAPAPVNNGGPSQPTAPGEPTFNNTGGNGVAFTPINAGRSRQSGFSAASAPTNTSAFNQHAKPGASASCSAVGHGQTAPSTPSIVTKTSAPSQPATPTPDKARGSKQGNNNLFVAPAFVNQDAQMRAALSAGPMGKGELLDTIKYPGPLGKPMAQYGNQRPQNSGPGVNERPPAYTRGQYSFPQEPQQAQSYSQYFPQQYHSPGNYVSSQQAFHGFQQGNPQRFNFPQSDPQFQMQGSQGGLEQSPMYHQPPQYGQTTGIHYGNGNALQGHTTNLHRKGQVVRVQKDGKLNVSPHGKIGAVQRNPQFTGFAQHGPIVQHGQMARIRLSGPHSYVVNHYYQSHAPGDFAGQALPITQGEHDQYPDYEQDMDYSQAVGPDQGLNDDQAIVYAKTSDNKAPINFEDWVHVSTYHTSTNFLDEILTAALVIPHYSDLPSVELLSGGYRGRRR